MRDEYLRVYRPWVAWAQGNKAESDYPDSDKFMQSGLACRRVELAFPTNNAVPTRQ